LAKSVILGGARTPIGRLNGALASKTATELGGIAIEAAICRSSVTPADIEHVIMGQVLQGGAGQIPSRQAAFNAGLDKTVTSETINRVCGSGMRAINLADLQIRCGEHQVIVAGGMESMTNAPHLLRGVRGGIRFGNGALEDMVLTDGLLCAVDCVQMGTHADNVSAEEELGREAQDAWALRSHQRAIAAQDSGLRRDEIVPVEIAGKKGTMVVDADEAPRRDTSGEALAKLRPAFSQEGTTTAGNAPGVNDGAAALVVASDEWAASRGIKPLATILGQGEAAWGAPYLAYTPAMAAEIALNKAGITAADLALVELNEAFASVACIASRRLGVSDEIVNVNGGAVALGHPIGMSGARIVLTLILELRRRGGGYGLAAICSGGGQGDAIVVHVDGGAS
jgi:acetyl-CoA C-acetyltransferase